LTELVRSIDSGFYIEPLKLTVTEHVRTRVFPALNGGPNRRGPSPRNRRSSLAPVGRQGGASNRRGLGRALCLMIALAGALDDRRVALRPARLGLFFAAHV
jgi:hypothetical protein